MKILTARDFLISKWSGGTTTQLYIFPEGTSLADRNFDWRISSAAVEAEESDFTVFEGYDRILIPLEGKLEMEHQTPTGIIYQRVDELELARFNGEWLTKGRGKLTDFNLIFKSQYDVKVHIDYFSERTSLTVDERIRILFLQTGSFIINGRSVHSPAILSNDEGQKVDITYAAGTRIISVEING